ncbi:hypothetical protein DUNSADRAFT_8739 [Dunaliella salina]|uniref:Uncharacterized protein n=1 Tax=Dunaliella salina TaxID=3046 RepID=A0ABQ7GIY4_DUNSA|nr:hypothetical protein DUNSADRAFT_8739 [Dunaliella salina]|eukprot:KAF5834572.1 hypothetical protein DUNSADRAFT_8739 [Dunaliella salina]
MALALVCQQPGSQVFSGSRHRSASFWITYIFVMALALICQLLDYLHVGIDLPALGWQDQQLCGFNLTYPDSE